MPELIFCIVYTTAFSILYRRKYIRLLQRYKTIRHLLVVKTIELHANRMAMRKMENDPSDIFCGSKGRKDEH